MEIPEEQSSDSQISEEADELKKGLLELLEK